MDIAETMADKIYSWVALLQQCADKLNQLADKMEDTQKDVNVTKVVGSSVSVAGAAAMTAAGIATIFTGGAALPFIAVAGGAASWLGLATNETSDVVNVVASQNTLKEVEDIVKKIQDLHQEMLILVESAKQEEHKKGGHHGSCSDDYLIELILRAMAKCNRLILDDFFSLLKFLDDHFKQAAKSMRLAFILFTGVAVTTISFSVLRLLAKIGTKASKGVVKEVAGKTAGKAVGRIAGGALGLAISIPELVNNCKNLDMSETEASLHLRQNAKAIRAESEEMKKNLQQIEKLFQKLARVKHCIQNTPKSDEDKKAVIQFVTEYFENEVIQQWLNKESGVEAFFILLNLFESVRNEIVEKEEKKKKTEKKKIIDITFVAHGEINSDFMIPATWLLPQQIEAVLLYSPWNCYIDAETAYGIATGRIKPEHRLFGRVEKTVLVLDESRRPHGLPGRWNSMRKAGHQAIPNITVSPKNTPKDAAFERFKILEDKFGSPNTSRVVILYTPPGPELPFYVVILALSLVLFFSDSTANIHLAACLGEVSEVDRRWDLQQQYAYTINDTFMSIKRDLFSIKDEELYRTLKVLFGETPFMY